MAAGLKKDGTKEFIYYATGDSVMDTLLNEPHRKDTQFEYIVKPNMSKLELEEEPIYSIQNRLLLDLRKNKFVDQIDQNIKDLSITGVYRAGHEKVGREVKFRLCADLDIFQICELDHYIKKYRDFTINSICRNMSVNNLTTYIDHVNGMKHKELRFVKTVRTPEDIFYDHPLKIFKAIHLVISRNLIMGSDIQTFISEVNYVNLFKDTKKEDIRKWLKYLINQNPMMFKKQIQQFTNLTNYLYINREYWK